MRRAAAGAKGAEALVAGDSRGQVASQTLENLATASARGTAPSSESGRSPEGNHPLQRSY